MIEGQIRNLPLENNFILSAGFSFVLPQFSDSRQLKPACTEVLAQTTCVEAITVAVFSMLIQLSFNKSSNRLSEAMKGKE